MNKLEIFQFYLSLLENFSTSENLFKTVWHPDFVSIELPNMMNHQGRKRNFQESLNQVFAAKDAFVKQQYEILNAFETETHLITELYWTGSLRTGGEHKCFLCIICEFQGDLIIKQKNYEAYDCASLKSTT